MKVVFRLDALVALGSGHLMRCLTLADALREQGASVTFIMRCDIDALRAEVLARGYGCHLLPVAVAGDWHVDAQHTMDVLRAEAMPDCLIVDHYGLDARWERVLRPLVRRLMVIDDLADRAHDCDILLDQNLHLQLQRRYQDLVAPECRQLLGPQFALLRPEFSDHRARLRERDGQVRQLAVFFGGTDPGGETLRTMPVIEDMLAAGAQWHCDVIVGAANPQRDQIRQICDRHEQLAFHCQISNMAERMAAADLCISAGGTALWERAVLGVPSLVIAIADNQLSATTVMAEAGALLYLGPSAQLERLRLRQALEFAQSNSWLLLSLAQRSLELVDGQGRMRVTACIMQECAGNL